MLAALSSETIGVAIVVSILGPAIVGLLTTRAARRNKLEDWARADTLEARQLEATKEVARIAAEAAEQARHARADVAKADADARAERTRINAQLVGIDTQGKVTHALVNSDMTDEKRGRLVQARATLAALRRIVARDEREGIPSTMDDLDAIKALLTEIAHLEKEIKARVDQQAKIDEAAGLTAGIVVKEVVQAVADKVVKEVVVQAVADKLAEDVGQPPDPAVIAVAEKLVAPPPAKAPKK